MNKTLQIKASLNAIKSQLDCDLWSIGSNDYKAFKSKVESLLTSDFSDYENDPQDDTEQPEMFGDIAIVCIHGVICYNTGLPEDVCELMGICDLAYVYNELYQIQNSPNISTVILDICSPGGTVSGLEETCALISNIAQNKNVIAFGSGVVASAAYELAVNAKDGIYVTPSSYVGSVGTIYKRYDLTQANIQDGVKVSIIASSPKKSWGDPDTPMSKDEEAWRNAQIARLTQEFKDTILANRDIDEALLDASVFSGTEAVANNYADGNVNSIQELVDFLTKS